MPDALIIVDYQNDFARPDGALSVPAGEEVAGHINGLAASGDYELVVATRDWHPPDHGSFTAQGGIWPVHCVQGTPGAELHPALDTGPIDAIVDKGQDPQTEGYSAFDATSLAETLRARGVDSVTVVLKPARCRCCTQLRQQPHPGSRTTTTVGVVCSARSAAMTKNVATMAAAMTKVRIDSILRY